MMRTALVVAPSQELAMQIVRVAKSLLPPDLRRHAVQQVIGGANPKRQAEALAAVPGPLLVVGTPGRLAEMIRTGALRLHPCPIMVLDEADQLLAPAFAEDINYISDHCGKRCPVAPGGAGAAAAASGSDTPAALAAGRGPDGAAARRQTVLVSATLTPTVLGRAARWCPDPCFVSAGAVPALAVHEEAAEAQGAAAENPSWGWGAKGWDGPASPLAPKTRGSAGGVEGEELVPTMPPQLLHYYMVTEPRHKVDVLRRTIHALGVQRSLVFMNFQQRLQDTQFKLQARGMKAAALHGELPRLARSNLLNAFRRGKMRALVVSDVAARGLDVPACDAVFNLELPSSAAHYAHRAGRTGRLSAALAAQAAAEARTAAAEAAAVLAEAGGEEGVPAARDAAATAAAAAAAADLLEQAAGTVVTVVTPGERFVVDKLSAQLGVPLLEAHVSHGQFRLGPPPAGYSFERDEESDRTDASEGARPAKRERKGAAGTVATEDSGHGRDAGAQASTSGRSSTGKAAAAAEPKRASIAAKGAAAKGQAEEAGQPGVKSDSKLRSSNNDKYEVIHDEDDEIVLDDEDRGDEDDRDFEILDEDLAALKRLRPAQIRQLAADGGEGGPKLAAAPRQRKVLEDLAPPNKGRKRPATGLGSGRGGEEGKRQGEGQGQEGGRTRGSSRGELLAELRRELEEMRAEKEAAGKGRKGRN
ncbi:hypothetical protein GPECTOR_6g578 [Gonium pectorale]|uniref:Uncharacterized protein n=1 Tax=Gonium pectorale TaxID=33097 RepID=A0A150GV02_GONPE|nr:hypothetical protein GPECTOR_6g578 [Gonium pectorale]|eukprot:KXZ53661.1 hypothetical protein GPECTOR_6g578 [Gonium pectorale]